MFWSQPANHLKCLPRLWQIAQVALNMFKPHNKISACLRPSARFKGWEQGNVTYWQPGLGPSSLISNWVMRPCFMFLLKTARNCTRSFELPSSTVCMGSVRAPFTSLQAQTVQATYSVPAALGPGQPWHPPGQSAQPGSSTLCKHTLYFVIASGKGDLPHPAILIPVSPSQILDTGYYSCRHQNFPICAYMLKAPVNS